MYETLTPNRREIKYQGRFQEDSSVAEKYKDVHEMSGAHVICGKSEKEAILESIDDMSVDENKEEMAEENALQKALLWNLQEWLKTTKMKKLSWMLQDATS